MNVSAYLNRIKYNKEVEIDKPTLFGLQRAHLLSVPFENLDIHYKNKIVLDMDIIFEKIVNRKRGGFCYELNSLFYTLLKEIGFNVKIISARVYSEKEQYGKVNDHMAILANIGTEQFLVDVGFGKFSLQPLPLKFNKTLVDDYGKFVFDNYDKDYLRVSEQKNNVLTPQYIFSTKQHKLSEFKDMCDYHQTSSESHFTQKKVISISTEIGRVTLNNSKVKITKGSKTKEIEFNEDQFETYLKKYFDIIVKIEEPK
ncbi:arylamine N-acetyltransferase [Flagellimonas sp. CMM7]|uniref:arylamine N-acetyltransferase family protein n=1 Tax=Flagellimonas sp. CMM7 TaxID=2654676 RepID=UPI0013D7EDEB|nr:arylamine N-acetyltransferase [Flagellimonas sp. CMM7]UII80620.1 arylamine N-acetyltransferase [Flagellimonas sp. CMM7]